MGRDTLLVVDANLPKPLVGSLKKRARNAISAAELGLSENVKDPELLRGLAERYNDSQEWVLVTGDDAMPAEHRQVIIDTQATIATIFPEYPEGVTEHAWNVDVVQRWAHAMQDQKRCTIRRYGLANSTPWRPRRRHIRTIAKEGLTPWRPEDAQRAEQMESTEGAGSGAGHEAPRLPGFD
jgi:hypothetical protein